MVKLKHNYIILYYMEKNLKIHKWEWVSYSIKRENFNLNEDISKKEVEKMFQTLNTGIRLKLIKISTEIQNKMWNPVHIWDTFDISENILKNFSSKDKIENVEKSKTIKEESKTKKDSSKIKIEASDDFNYKSPTYDKNWHLKSREDLYNPEQIEDWYSSVKELFTKLNSMEPTQIEALIKPYYYGEVDEKWEKIPTFIIIWDTHADEYNLSEKELEAIKDRNFITDKDESYKAETEVLSLLNKKFKINNFGLENEFYWKYFKTKIWKEVKRLGLNSFWLEKEKFLDANELFAKQISINYEIYKSLWVDLDINYSKDEISKYEEYMAKEMKKAAWKSVEDPIIDAFNEMKKLSKDELIFSYKVNRYFMEKTGILDSESEKILIENAKKSNKTYEQIIEKFTKWVSEMKKVIVDDRNQIWIDIASKQMWKDKMMVLVYWKAHSEDLMKQLKEKYNSKVNIYVAK